MAGRGIFRNIITLKSGEGFPAGHLFVLFFISSMGSCLGLSTGESLFIRHFGISQVPLMFLVTSVVVTFASLWIGQMGANKSFSAQIRTVYAIFLGILVLSAAVIFLFPDWKWIYILIFVTAYTSLANLKSLAVKLSEEIFDIRQMKRLFAPISAGAVLGMAVGGFGTGLFLKWLPDSRYLVLLWLGCTLASFALSARILKKFVIPSPFTGDTGSILNRFFSGFRHLGESKLLVGVSILSFLTAFMVLHYDFLYMFAVKKVYQDPDEITRIFGLVRGFSTLATFFLQVLVTPLLIRRMGITQTLLIFPVAFFGIFLVVLSHFGMANVFAGRYGYYITKEAFFFPSFQPLLNALSDRIRKQAVFFVNNAVASLGSVAGGIFLISLVKTSILTPKVSALISVLLSAAFMVLALTIRKTYLRELVANIQEQSPRQLDLIEALKKARSGSAPELLLPFLKRDDLESILFALEFLKDHRTPEVRDEIAALIRRSADPRIHKSAFEFFGNESDPALLSEGENFLKHEASGAFLFYLRRIQENPRLAASERERILALYRHGTLSEDRRVQIQSRTWQYEPGDESVRKESRAFFDELFTKGDREEIRFALNLFSRCHDDFFVYLVISRVDQFAGENRPFTGDFDLYLKVLLGMGHAGAFDLVLILIKRYPRLIHPTLRALTVLDKSLSSRAAERLLFVYDRESGVSPGGVHPEIFLRLLFSLPEIPTTLLHRLRAILFEKNLPSGLKLSLTAELVRHPTPLSEPEKKRLEFLVENEFAEAIEDILSVEEFAKWDAAFSDIYRDEMGRSLEKRIPLIGNLLILLRPEEKLAPAIAGLSSEERRTRSSALESLENALPARFSGPYLAILERDLEKLGKIRIPKIKSLSDDPPGMPAVLRLLTAESDWEKALGLHLAARLKVKVPPGLADGRHGEHPIFSELRKAVAVSAS